MYVIVVPGERHAGLDEAPGGGGGGGGTPDGGGGGGGGGGGLKNPLLEPEARFISLALGVEEGERR